MRCRSRPRTKPSHGTHQHQRCCAKDELASCLHAWLDGSGRRLLSPGSSGAGLTAFGSFSHLEGLLALSAFISSWGMWFHHPGGNRRGTPMQTNAKNRSQPFTPTQPRIFRSAQTGVLIHFRRSRVSKPVSVLEALICPFCAVAFVPSGSAFCRRTREAASGLSILFLGRGPLSRPQIGRGSDNEATPSPLTARLCPRTHIDPIFLLVQSHLGVSICISSEQSGENPRVHAH